jgi:flagellar basal-body rod modification protein FlgD
MTSVTSSTVQTAATGTTTGSSSTSTSNPKGVLDKNAFMKLLLTEMQYQDPTQPMDTDKILTQTSQLATLESADNTNNTLTTLAQTLQNSQQLSNAAIIGRIVDTGDNSIQSKGDGTATTFPIYFPSDVKSGTATVSDSNGNVVAKIGIGANTKGTYNLSWDGNDSSGKVAPKGSYTVSANYTDTSGNQQVTKTGIYPVDSIKFDGSNTLLGVGPNYVPLSSVQIIY